MQHSGQPVQGSCETAEGMERRDFKNSTSQLFASRATLRPSRGGLVATWVKPTPLVVRATAIFNLWFHVFRPASPHPSVKYPCIRLRPCNCPVALQPAHRLFRNGPLVMASSWTLPPAFLWRALCPDIVHGFAKAWTIGESRESCEKIASSKPWTSLEECLDSLLRLRCSIGRVRRVECNAIDAYTNSCTPCDFYR